jgi:hypothetical protein
MAVWTENAEIRLEVGHPAFARVDVLAREDGTGRLKMFSGIAQDRAVPAALPVGWTPIARINVPTMAHQVIQSDIEPMGRDGTGFNYDAGGLVAPGKLLGLGQGLAFGLRKQVGGTHYNSHTIQPFDIIDEYGLDFYGGCALKCLLRKKDGVSRREELEKCKHYIELMIERLPMEGAGSA